MQEYCFVIQPYDGGDFDNRFDDIIKPAVEECGLVAYRVDRDPYVEIAVSAIEEKIRDATIVVAEISVDNPNVWFELGYAMALDKKIIMLCDANSRLNGFPFDISHRNILLYRTGSMRDFVECKNKLQTRINAKLHRIRLAQLDNALSQEEKVILKLLSRDQKIPQAMTPEEKIIKDGMDKDKITDCLRSLTNKSYVEYRISTIGGSGFYQLTSKGMNFITEGTYGI